MSTTPFTTFIKGLLLAWLILPGLTFGEAGNSVDSNKGKTSINLRYRAEFVNQTGFDDEALASTLRFRLSWEAPTWRNWSGLAEFDAVTEFGSDNFNSGAGTSSPSRSSYPVVADPDYTEVNQFYLSYSGFADTALKIGRQRVLLDNQRFVGGVGWRQNEQTYDAVRITNTSFYQSSIDYIYVDNVNRIFGDDVPAGDHDSETHLLNVRRDFNDYGKLTGYFYNINNRDLAGFSTQTLGIRYQQSNMVSGRKLNWVAELATQSDAHNNPVNYDANYWRVDGSLAFDRFSALAGYESLEGDQSNAGSAFRTPLATLHAFNGWADTFLATPDAGLEDLFLGAKGKYRNMNWQVIWHDFNAQSGRDSYGSELDAALSMKINSKVSGLAKLANFNSDDPAFRNSTKFWLMLTATL